MVLKSAVHSLTSSFELILIENLVHPHSHQIDPNPVHDIRIKMSLLQSDEPSLVKASHRDKMVSRQQTFPQVQMTDRLSLE